MNKFTEMVTTSVQMSNTLTSALSSTVLLDMSAFKKYIAPVVAAKPSDNTTFTGNLTVTIYESTAATWNGAVATAMTSFVATATCNSGTTGYVIQEVDDFKMSANDGKRYLGAYAQAWTKTAMSLVVERYREDVEPSE